MNYAASQAVTTERYLCKLFAEIITTSYFLFTHRANEHATIFHLITKLHTAFSFAHD